MLNQVSQNDKRIKWIDTAKFIAIIGVLVDHTNGILYTDKRIAYISYYSVSLFIVIMGITSYLSYKNSAGSMSVPEKLKKNSLKIIIPYIEATLIYCIFIHKRIQFPEFLEHLINFDATTPFYYAALYLQLVLITPALYYIFQTSDRKKNRFLVELAGFFVIIIIARLTNYYTKLFNIYGGGGKLFGGHFLILFYLGMWFGKYYCRILLKTGTALIGSVLSLGLTAGCAAFISKDQLHIDSVLHCAPGLNPPGISLSVYAISTATAIFFLGQLTKLSENKILTKLFTLAAFPGKHTLYVFLYHNLFIHFIFPLIRRTTGLKIQHLLLRGVLYFIIIYIGSLLIEVFLKKLNSIMRNFFVHAYTSIE